MNAPVSRLGEAIAALAPKSRGGGRVVMFVQASAGEDTAGIVRSCAESLSGPTLLIDLDLRRDAHAAHYRDRLGAGVDARADGASFHRVLDAQGNRVAERALQRCRVGATSLSITRFARESIAREMRVQVSGARAYWDALRAQGGITLVDAPALDRAPYVRALLAAMDGVVLVISDAPGAAPRAIDARAALDAAGATIAGLVYAQHERPPRFLSKIMRYAGELAATP